MAVTIAISGKGGSGKTTLASMIIRVLTEHSKASVLAVDADPNSCLGLAMGVETAGTIAEVREQARTKTPNSGGLDRVRSFEYGIQQAITEAKGFDLLTMGRPEGPDCYCAANNLLREFMDKLSSQYDFVVIDNEAGMEHLSRRTTNNVDLLCIVAEHTPIGEITARRIFELARSLPISVKQTGVIWNRSDAAGNLDDIEILGSIPYDQQVVETFAQGKNIYNLEINSSAFLAVCQIMKKIVIFGKN